MKIEDYTHQFFNTVKTKYEEMSSTYKDNFKEIQEKDTAFKTES